jgi:hypothetical protein
MKTFYSAEDMEALVAQGIMELRLDEDTVLTHLARDTAQKLGISLVYGGADARGIPSAATPGTAARQAPSVGAKPKGCQHGLLTSRSSGGVGSAGSSDETVSELIGLVRQLADKGKS